MKRPILLYVLIASATITHLAAARTNNGHWNVLPTDSGLGPTVTMLLAADEATERAKKATDRLTSEEENKEMPLPGQGYSHGSPLVDKAHEQEKSDAVLDKLEEEGKIVESPPRRESEKRTN